MFSGIRRANKLDYQAVIQWLKIEDQLEREGCFYCNRSIIEEAYDSKLGQELYVLIEKEEPIAFLVGNIKAHEILILAVKFEKRGNGFGKQLAKFYIDKLFDNDETFIEIQCRPVSSKPFWKSLGFTMFKDEFISKDLAHYKDHGFLMLEKNNYIENSWKEVDLEIVFYPEQVKYKGSTLLTVGAFMNSSESQSFLNFQTLVR